MNLFLILISMLLFSDTFALPPSENIADGGDKVGGGGTLGAGDVSFRIQKLFSSAAKQCAGKNSSPCNQIKLVAADLLELDVILVSTSAECVGPDGRFRDGVNWPGHICLSRSWKNTKKSPREAASHLIHETLSSFGHENSDQFELSNEVLAILDLIPLDYGQLFRDAIQSQKKLFEYFSASETYINCSSSYCHDRLNAQNRFEALRKCRLALWTNCQIVSEEAHSDGYSFSTYAWALGSNFSNIEKIPVEVRLCATDPSTDDIENALQAKANQSCFENHSPIRECRLDQASKFRHWSCYSPKSELKCLCGQAQIELKMLDFSKKH